MTDWTTPKDWAVLEQVTAANMNTVRDNLKYLKEQVDIITPGEVHGYAVEYNPTGTNDLTTSTSYVDTSLSLEITTTVQCTFLIFAVWRQGISTANSATSSVQLLEGANSLVVRTSQQGDGAVAAQPWVGKLVEKAAGTYTFKFQHKTSNASYSSRFDHGCLMVLAIPD